MTDSRPTVIPGRPRRTGRRGEPPERAQRRQREQARRREPVQRRRPHHPPQQRVPPCPPPRGARCRVAVTRPATAAAGPSPSAAAVTVRAWRPAAGTMSPAVPPGSVRADAESPSRSGLGRAPTVTSSDSRDAFRDSATADAPPSVSLRGVAAAPAVRVSRAADGLTTSAGGPTGRRWAAGSPRPGLPGPQEPTSASAPATRIPSPRRRPAGAALSAKCCAAPATTPAPLPR